MYKQIRSFLLTVFWHLGFKKYTSKRMERHMRGYKEYWTKPEYKEYRERFAKSTIASHPTLEEMRRVFDRYGASTILEVGCGYGRLLEQLVPYYKVVGLDVAEEYIEAAQKKGLDVFYFDIISENHSERSKTKLIAYDTVFCSRFTMYFYEKPEEMKTAMQVMESLARKKVIVWEWPHIIDYMKKVYPSDTFEYHSIPTGKP